MMIFVIRSIVMKNISKHKTVSILNQKGGAGKTTLATNLARALQSLKHNVLLVDSDPQGSARDWNECNNGNLIPVVGLDRESLAKDLQAISLGYDWIVIDGAPQIAKLSAAAVKASDIVLIPVQPSPYDVWACSDLVEIIKARQELNDGEPKAAFIVSRAIRNSKLENEVKIALKEYGIPLMTAYTTHRVIYPTVASDGKTVFESNDQKAKDEILSITEEMLRRLNGIAN